MNSMKLKTAIRASLCERKRRRSSRLLKKALVRALLVWFIGSEGIRSAMDAERGRTGG